MNLYTCGERFIATTTTDTDGLYEFCDLDEGCYCVEVELPEGYEFSPEDAGSDDAADSDVDGNGIACVELTEDDDTIDAGLCEEKKGGEGCTPGYWKNHLWAWDATPYSPGDSYDGTFGVTLFPGMTLEQVINQGGGGYMRIGRHSVAALLSAAHADVEIVAFDGRFACEPRVNCTW